MERRRARPAWPGATPLSSRKRRDWITGATALLFFVALASLPFALQGQAAPWAQAAQRVAPVPLVPPAPSLPLLALSSSAQPQHPNDAPASMPVVDSVRAASLVAAEDLRLRTLLHHISRIAYPVLMPGIGQFDASTGTTGAGIPTLVLPGPATYTIADLEGAGVVIAQLQGGYLLVDNVLVTQGGTLKLTGFPTLLMDSSKNGFTSLVTWGGTLSLAGASPAAPLTVTGWDRTLNGPAVDNGYGRPYIRAVGGELDLLNVHASSLGFWSGRTGGVAWTGISSRASTGGAISSTFVGNTYGAFVSRGTKVTFSDDLFEGNELDGLRLHRFTMNSSVNRSASVRNGANGFVVSRGAVGNVLKEDLAINNRANGFLINGQSLVRGASPSGGQAVASQGTVVESSEAENNGRTGILVEGGDGTVIWRNTVCGAVTGIAVRAGASTTYVVGNDVRCGGRVALSIGPAVTGTTVSGNVLHSARIGLLIRNAPGVRIMNNWITDASLFGISVRGSSPGVVGNENVITGRGFQAIDTRGGAETPTLRSTNLSGWQHRSSISLISYLRYHPLLTTWLIILVVVVISSIAIRFRRRPAQPYAYTIPWRLAPPVTGAYAIAEPQPVAASAPRASPAGAAVTVAVLERGMATASMRSSSTLERSATAAGDGVPYRPVLYRPFEPAAKDGAHEAPARTPKAKTHRARREQIAPETRVTPAQTPRGVERDQEDGDRPAAETARPDGFWQLLAAGSWTSDERMTEEEAQEAPA